MAQFIPFHEAVEMSGESVIAFINALPTYKPTMLSILAKHGIEDPQPGKWYPEKLWLNAMKEVSERYGVNTLFEIGKALPDHALFPSEIRDLKQALDAIDVAYRMNHRGGYIGYYQLKEFNDKKRYAVMECKTPSPCHYDRGLITTMARKFRPKDALPIKVELDTSKPTRLEGAECKPKFNS